MKRSKRQRPEEKVQLRVCAYLKKVYPQVIFQCDIGSGMNLGKKIGGMNTRLRSSRGLPDLFIAYPAKITSEYTSRSATQSPTFTKESIEIQKHGLFIELKKEDCRLKNGGIAKSKHHAEQEEILKRLKGLNYKADFACGYSEAVKLIDDYLGKK